jgi:hypothetical protein
MILEFPAETLMRAAIATVGNLYKSATAKTGLHPKQSEKWPLS